MKDNLPPIRRVVTENDAKGRSRIVEDAPASSVKPLISNFTQLQGRPAWNLKTSLQRVSFKS